MIQISREQVDDAMKNRAEPMKVDGLVSTLRDLSRPRDEDPAALAEAMDRIAGFQSAVESLVDFMVSPEREQDKARYRDPIEVLETLGPSRARNLALTTEVKRRIVDKDGNRYSPDLIGVTANAACSIALRNAVLKAIPQSLWKGLYTAAEKTIMGSAGAEKVV